jgi:hypothetical protein
MPRGAGFEGNTDYISMLAGGRGDAGQAPPVANFEGNRNLLNPSTQFSSFQPPVNRTQPRPYAGLPNFNPAPQQVGFPANIGDRSITGPQPTPLMSQAPPAPVGPSSPQASMRAATTGERLGDMGSNFMNFINQQPVAQVLGSPAGQAATLGMGGAGLARMANTPQGQQAIRLFLESMRKGRYGDPSKLIRPGGLPIGGGR